MEKDFNNRVEEYNRLVEQELTRAKTRDFICLTDLLVIKENLIRIEAKKRLLKN
jgi:hypothetical protein